MAGQDGAPLAEKLLGKGYVVHGIKRRSSSFNTARIDHICTDPHVPDAKFFLNYGDMADANSLIRLSQSARTARGRSVSACALDTGDNNWKRMQSRRVHWITISDRE